MYKKIVSFIMIACLCIGTAFAAYGTVYCDLQAGTDNSLYWADDGTLKNLYRTRCRAATSERAASASDVVNIYAKATILDNDSGELYEIAENLDHYVTSTSATTDYYERKEEDPVTSISLMGLSRARYVDDTVSEHTNTLGQRSKSSEARSNMGPVEIRSDFGKNQMLETATHSIITERFKNDLSDYTYIAFCDIWNFNGETLTPNLLPLKSILTDIFVDAQEGDFLPAGFWYNGANAYALQELNSGKYQLTEYSLASPTVVSSTDNFSFHNDYSVVSVTIK